MITFFGAPVSKTIIAPGSPETGLAAVSLYDRPKLKTVPRDRVGRRMRESIGHPGSAAYHEYQRSRIETRGELSNFE